MFDGILGILSGLFGAFAGIFNGFFGMSADGDAGRGMINQPDEVAPIHTEGERPRGLSEPITIDGARLDPTDATLRGVAEKKALNFEDVTRRGAAANDDGDGGGTVLNAREE